jgi:O-acetyl-ADP-ribose deacetylase (regulator of RNase III)
LPFKAIIHVAGLNMLWMTSETAIRNCVRNALILAQQNGYRSIAFPLIGAGTGGMKAEQVLKLMQESAVQVDYAGEVRFIRFKSQR